MPTLPAFMSPGRWYWRVLVHLFCLVPAVLLTRALLNGGLGPDPAKELALESGEMAIRLLMLCLTVSPLRRLTGNGALLLWRRPLGLWTFAWTAAHAAIFAVFYLQLDLALLWQETLERPYITVGFLALLLMVPLAATSTRAQIRRLGANWRLLHRLIYLAAVLALLHLVWQIREEWGEAFFYSFWLALLFGERLYRRWRKK